jgi:ferredoxin, 2Fe-2S
MIEIKFIEADGAEKVVKVPADTTVMAAALENGVSGILGDCGGACACATCHCYVDEAFTKLIPEADAIEGSMLDFASDPRPNSRLGCQIVVTEELDGLVIRLPESQYE